MSTLLKKVTSTVSALTVVVASVGSTLTVSAASEFAMYAENLAQAGVINTQATEAGYRLGDNITRAEMAKIAVKLAGSEAASCAGNVYSDVTSTLGDLCGYIEAAADAGIVSKANAKFRPMDLVTRAEMVKMLLAASGVAPTDVSAGFSDVPASLGDLAGYINAGVEEGCVKAGSMFRPNATSSRGEAFKVAACIAGLSDGEPVTPPVDNGTGTTTPPTGTGTTTPTTPVATGDLSTALNPATPAATTLPTGSAYNKVLAVDLTAGSADAAVTGFEVTRTGLISNSNINGISVWVDGARVGNVVQSLSSDGKATLSFASTPIVVKAGTTKTAVFAINIKAGVYSGTVGLTLSKVVAGGSVTGTPVSSNVHSVVDGSSSIAAYTVTSVAVGGSTDETTATTLDIGQSTEIAKIKLSQSNSKEDLAVEGLNIFMEGSAADGDLTNFEIYSQEGTKLGSVVSAAGRYVNFVFDKAYTIPQGTSRYFSVKASIAAGKYNSGRTFAASVRDDFDVVAKGVTTGNYLLPTSVSVTKYYFKVNSGSLTISKSTDSPSKAIGQGVDDVVLATYDFKASGEDIELQKLNFQVLTGATTPALRGTVKLVVDGSTVYSTDAATAANYTADGANAGYLSSYVTIKAGSTAKISVVGSTSTSAAAGSTYQAKLLSASYKLTSSNTITTNSSVAITGNSISVEATTLTATANASFNPGNIVRGQSAAKVGSFNLQASNADDINVTAMNVKLSAVTGINNVTLKVGSKQLGTAISNPSLAGNAVSISSGDLKVPANTTVTVDVYADITSAAATGSLIAKLTQDGTTGVGVKTSKDVTAPTGADLASATITVTTGGALTLNNDSQTPGQQILVAGTSNVEVLRFQLKADNNEDIRLDKLYISTGSSNSGSLGANYTNVKLYDGATQIGSAATFNSDVAQFTGLNYVVPKGSTKNLSVRVDTTTSGVLQKGATIVIKPSYIEYTGVAGGTLASSSSITAGASKVMTLHDVKPTITNLLANSTMAASANQVVGTYKVKADGVRDLVLTGVTITTAGSWAGGSGAVTGFDMWYNNASVATGALSSDTTNGTVTFTFASPITVTAGSDVVLTLKANTSAIRTGVTSSATVSFNTYIDGTTGGAGGLSWNYTDVNGNASGTLTVSDSYPVTGATLTY